MTLVTAHKMERVKGIEPSSPAWKAGALPLCYTRMDCESAYTIQVIFELTSFEREKSNDGVLAVGMKKYVAAASSPSDQKYG